MKRFLIIALTFFLTSGSLFAADVKSKYGTQGVAMTCTLAGLANAAARECTVVDNTTNLYLDAGVFFIIKSNAAGTSSTGYVNFYAYGTANNGTNYTQSATGSDAGITLTAPPNVKMVGRCNVVANATSYSCGPFAVAPAFGGLLPQKWGIIVENQTAAALDNTEGSHLKVYQGFYAQVN